MLSEYATNLNPQNELYRYQALLDLADLMVRHYSLSELFHEIAVRLQRVAEFQLLHFGLHDPKENVMRRHLWEGEGPVVLRLFHSAIPPAGTFGRTRRRC